MNSSSSGGSGKRGRDGQLKGCSLTQSTYSESAATTRSASMSSEYDFSITGGGSCRLLGPFSVASDYDNGDDDDDNAYYANNSVFDKVKGGVCSNTDIGEEEEEVDTNSNQLMDSTTTMIRRRETNDDDDGGIRPPLHYHHNQQHQQNPHVIELVSEPILMEEDSALLQQKISSSSDSSSSSSAVDNDEWCNTDNEETHHRCGTACCDRFHNKQGDTEEYYGTIEDDGDGIRPKPQTTTMHDTDGDGGAGSTPSLAASDQVAVLAIHNEPVVVDHRDFRTIPDTITFTNNTTNTNINNQIDNNTNDTDYQRKNLKYTSLKDLLRCDTTAEQHQSPNDRIRRSEDVVVVGEEEEKFPAAVRIKGPISLLFPMGINGDTNVDDKVKADIPDECTIECHSTGSGCILVPEDDDELITSHLTLEQHTTLITAPPLPLITTTTTTSTTSTTITTTTATKMERGLSILDDDFYRKTNFRIPATDVVSSSELKNNNIKDGGGGGLVLVRCYWYRKWDCWK